MASLCFAQHAHQKPPTPIFPALSHLTPIISSSFVKPLLTELRKASLRLDVLKAVHSAPRKLLDSVVDSTFRFVDQPMLPSQDQIHSLEGEGMLHVLYFSRTAEDKKWSIRYKNRYVETETFKLERERGRPSFLPAVEGDSPAVLVAYLFNQLRFGKPNKNMSNTNVFEHSGRIFYVAENSMPQEIDTFSLGTYGNWDISGAWDRPFTSHPKKAPGSGELIIIGVDATKPFVVLGIISADGKKLKHKVDLKFEKTTLCHDLGVTEMYNIILDMKVTVDINRLVKGGPLIEYEKERYARIGVMPRYGDADSIKWFEVERCSMFHIINCFENGDEVVVRGCCARDSIIPGPALGRDKHSWFSKGFKKTLEEEKCVDNPKEGYLITRVYEWRLNMTNGNVKEGYLTGTDHSIDFPMINDRLIGLNNKYAYGQVIDSEASSTSALSKYGGLAKFYLAEQTNIVSELERHTNGRIKMDLHRFDENQFCSSAAFVPKQGASDEDDGWIISFVHDEDTNTSQVHIIDTKRFESEPVSKITLPRRVPYGFHGVFIPKASRQ